MPNNRSFILGLFISYQYLKEGIREEAQLGRVGSCWVILYDKMIMIFMFCCIVEGVDINIFTLLIRKHLPGSVLVFIISTILCFRQFNSSHWPYWELLQVPSQFQCVDSDYQKVWLFKMCTVITHVQYCSTKSILVYMV